MNEIIVIGIDPGKKGGICLLGQVSGIISLSAMPLMGKKIDFGQVADLAWEAKEAQGDLVYCYIEKVSAMPRRSGSKVFTPGVTSMLNFGFGAGGLHGIMAAYKIPVIDPSPTAWKRVVLKGTKKDKAAAIAFTRMKYPKISLLATPRSRVPHNGMADALCLAEYGIRDLKEQGVI